MRLVLNRIEDLRRAGLTSLMVVAEPVPPSGPSKGTRPLRLDVHRTCIGKEGDLNKGALATLLKVVIGIDDLARAVLPREELALCADLGRVAL